MVYAPDSTSVFPLPNGDTCITKKNDHPLKPPLVQALLDSSRQQGERFSQSRVSKPSIDFQTRFRYRFGQ
uniref:Uncharacterized protein n=1 Tax=Cannabis sativa TaxID=3483 RepID=A0A803QYD7_CANSA